MYKPILRQYSPKMITIVFNYKDVFNLLTLYNAFARSILKVLNTRRLTKAAR